MLLLASLCSSAALHTARISRPAIQLRGGGGGVRMLGSLFGLMPDPGRYRGGTWTGENAVSPLVGSGLRIPIGTPGSSSEGSGGTSPNKSSLSWPETAASKGSWSVGSSWAQLGAPSSGYVAMERDRFAGLGKQQPEDEIKR